MKLEIELKDEFVDILKFYIHNDIFDSDSKDIHVDIPMFIYDHLLNSLDDDRIIELLDESDLCLASCIQVRAKDE